MPRAVFGAPPAPTAPEWEPVEYELAGHPFRAVDLPTVEVVAAAALTASGDPDHATLLVAIVNFLRDTVHPDDLADLNTLLAAGTVDGGDLADLFVWLTGEYATRVGELAPAAPMPRAEPTLDLAAPEPPSRHTTLEELQRVTRHIGEIGVPVG